MSYPCVEGDELDENMYENDDLYDDSEQIDNLFENVCIFYRDNRQWMAFC